MRLCCPAHEPGDILPSGSCATGVRPSGHNAEAERLAVVATAFFPIGSILFCKSDLSGDQALLFDVTLEFDGNSDLQKLAIDQVGLAYRYFRPAAVIEESGVFFTEPFFYYCLQNPPLSWYPTLV